MCDLTNPQSPIPNPDLNSFAQCSNVDRLPADPRDDLPAPRRTIRRACVDPAEPCRRHTLRVARRRLQRVQRVRRQVVRIVHLRAVERIEQLGTHANRPAAWQWKFSPEAELLVRTTRVPEVVVKSW